MNPLEQALENLKNAASSTTPLALEVSATLFQNYQTLQAAVADYQRLKAAEGESVESDEVVAPTS